jgi:carbamoyl-phosphate synthase small subunit
VGIANVDTRALVVYVRNKGAMNAIISSEELDIEILKQKLAAVPSMEGLELSSEVSTKQPYFVGNPESNLRVAILDLGVKKNIIRSLVSRGCYVGVFPGHTSFAEMQSWNPNGYQISNGPGDPSAMPYAIETVKAILESNMPLFGICLGHQVLAQAAGIGTFKMFNGHRGGNHPVKNMETGICEITSQNHGFSVVTEQVHQHPDIAVTHINLNDQTIEGIRLLNKPAFSVQYHPEANPGPHDSRYLFDQFVSMMS